MDKKDIVINTSEIKINIGVNKQNIPVKIDWKASATADEGAKEAKAMLVSLFDKSTKDTMKIDLWTKEMQVIEMDRFMYQTLRGMADTYFKATQNQKLAIEMQKFIQYFGEQTEILKKNV